MVDGDIAQWWIRELGFRQGYRWLIKVGGLIAERYWV